MPKRFDPERFISRDVTSNNSFHLVVCLTTGPKPLPKRALQIVRSTASSFKWEYPLLSLRSSNSFLCLLPCLPVTSIPPCIFRSVTRCRRQFLGKMWPIQFAFRIVHCAGSVGWWRKPRHIFFVNVRPWPWPHSDRHIWAPFSWSLRIFKTKAWGPTGASVMLRGPFDWTWGTKGQFMGPRCIGAARSRTLDILILIQGVFNP